MAAFTTSSSAAPPVFGDSPQIHEAGRTAVVVLLNSRTVPTYGSSRSFALEDDVEFVDEERAGVPASVEAPGVEGLVFLHGCDQTGDDEVVPTLVVGISRPNEEALG